jgi:hypothetical protein
MSLSSWIRLCGTTKYGARMLRARSIGEAWLYVELQPCKECGEGQFMPSHERERRDHAV